VDGLYNSFELLVYTVVGVPLVAAANMGYRFDAVLVSLLSVAPDVMLENERTPEPLVIRICPFVPSVVGYLRLAGLFIIRLTVPEAFLVYRATSASLILRANSPFTKFPDVGAVPLDVV